MHSAAHTAHTERDRRVRLLTMMIAIAVALLAICLLILVIHNVSYSGNQEDHKTPSGKKDFKISFTSLPKASADTKTGNLVLVNNDHEFTFPESEDGLVKMYTYRQQNTTSGQPYKLGGDMIRLREPAASQMHNMLVKFNQLTGNGLVNITSAYRSYDDQKSLNSSISAGHSDSHTGLGCSLKYYSNEQSGTLRSDLNTYGWLFENCYEYGFIVRYPEGHETHTGVSDYTNYFRYVGYPHAWYMMYGNTQNASDSTDAETSAEAVTGTPDASGTSVREPVYCLEEYLTLLKQYPYSGTHLRFTAGNGITYEIYYVAAETSKELTEIPVPENDTYLYEISGDNNGGFIVTITLG